MASIDQIRASDGSGNANVATVQSSRSPLASTIIVDTVVGINATFMGSMGTPHTFVDPITSEEITVISEATVVDFSGHVDGSNLEIDDIAPGYTDLGSEVGDIVIIRPTTQWGDNVADVLDVSHDDDGGLKDDIVDTPQIADGAVEADQLGAGAATPAKRSGGFKIGTFTVSATGAQSVTGVGFTPKFIAIYNSDGANTLAIFSLTIYDGTTTRSIGLEASTAAANSYANTNFSVEDRTNTTIIAGTMTSLDTDGFTFNITTKTTNRNFVYVAYG